MADQKHQLRLGQFFWILDLEWKNLSWLRRVSQTDSLLTDRLTLTRSKHLISANCLQHISPLRFKEKKQYLFVEPSSTDILPSPSSRCLGRAGLSAIKVNAFKTSCWSWRVAGQLWLYWAPGFLLSWHRNLPTRFLEHLRFPPSSLPVPAVILKRSASLTSKQGFMCRYSPPSPLSRPRMINRM